MSDQAANVKTIRRSDVVSQIESKLAGRISSAALAGWAFDRFYAEELGSEVYESGAESAIADVLDALMFGDDPGFGLDDAELRTMVTQLNEA